MALHWKLRDSQDEKAEAVQLHYLGLPRHILGACETAALANSDLCVLFGTEAFQALHCVKERADKLGNEC